MTNQGWECPRCHQCYAPTVKKCKDCKPMLTQPAPYWPWPTYPYWYVHPTPITYGPIEVICTSTGSPEGITYTVINDPGVSIYSTCVALDRGDMQYTLTVQA